MMDKPLSSCLYRVGEHSIWWEVLAGALLRPCTVCLQVTEGRMWFRREYGVPCCLGCAITYVNAASIEDEVAVVADAEWPGSEVGGVGSR